MASIKLRGDTSGELVIEAPAVAGNVSVLLPATLGADILMLPEESPCKLILAIVTPLV